jgi:hypothetical protein
VPPVPLRDRLPLRRQHPLGDTLGPFDIAEVVAMGDPVERNHCITQTYHDLALAMQRVVGSEDGTWCSFAVWASNQAGQMIRLDEVPAHLATLLEVSDRYRLAHRGLRGAVDHSDVLRLVDRSLMDVSDNMAEGNVVVYGELAPAYAAMIAGEPMPAGAPDPVVRAFASYAAAADEDDRRLKAQHVLLGNALAVLHEQTRLQPYIEQGLNAGPADAAMALAHDRLAADELAYFEPHLRRLGAEVEGAWDRTMTERFMTLSTPDEVLHLGEDLLPRPGEPLFPPALEELVLPALVAFAEEWDRTGGTGIRSGARDWVSLPDRMDYIFNLFRSRQQDPTLASPPFGPDETPLIELR